MSVIKQFAFKKQCKLVLTKLKKKVCYKYDVARRFRKLQDLFKKASFSDHIFLFETFCSVFASSET